MAQPQVAFDYNFRKSWVWQCDKCNARVLCDNETGPPDWKIEGDRTICEDCKE